MNIQKILPTCAVAMGVALVLATSAFKQAPKDKSGDPMYTFVYNPPSGSYSVGDVQNTLHWSYDPDNGECDLGSDEACRIHVSADNVVPDGSSYDLASGFTISAQESSPSVAYVDGTSDGTDPSYYTNKP